MNDKRKCFTFIWKIKNFSFSFNYSNCFNSPDFIIPEISGSKWKLVLYSQSNLFKSYLVCRLWNLSGPNNLKLDYELSFLTSDGSVLFSEIVYKRAFDLPLVTNSELKAEKNDVFLYKKHLFIPDDTLTIRCRMWKNKKPMLESVKCCAETRINTETRSFVGTIKQFSSLKTNSLNMFCIISSSEEFPLSSMNLRISVDGKLYIEVNPAIYKPCAMYKFKLFIIDAYGNKVKSCKGEICDKAPFCIPLAFSLEYLIRNKELYLPNSELTLEGKVIFPNDHKIFNSLEEINDMIYDYSCEDVQPATTDAKNTGDVQEARTDAKNTGDVQEAKTDAKNTGDVQAATTDAKNIDVQEAMTDAKNTGDVQEAMTDAKNTGDVQAAMTDAKNAKTSEEEYHTESLTTLIDDLISFLDEETLYDTKLKTATETFPAHTVVLSARSSVFKSMFLNDMKEKMKGCVDIEDIDANTVRQMLLFMYKDTIDNLDYEGAKSLYYAADKYNIVSLRNRCSNLLKQNLQYLNCCDVLILADRHQDLKLKKCVQVYIEENDEAVFSSEEWKNMEKNYPQLTIETILALYKKSKKS